MNKKLEMFKEISLPRNVFIIIIILLIVFWPQRFQSGLRIVFPLYNEATELVYSMLSRFGKR